MLITDLIGHLVGWLLLMVSLYFIQRLEFLGEKIRVWSNPDDPKSRIQTIRSNPDDPWANPDDP